MQDFLKYIRPTFSRDAISDCANSLINLKKLKMTYPPENEQIKELCINIKA